MNEREPVFPELIGGARCLDLANTVVPRRPLPGTEQVDRIPDYRECVNWAAYAGFLEPDAARQLKQVAQAEQAAAAEVHGRVLALREAIYETYGAIADHRPVPPEGLAALRDFYSNALGRAELDTTESAQVLEWTWADDALETPLWRFAASAMDLARTGPLTRVKRCPGDDGQCGWLFHDLSKSATRRWCSMNICGGRVKSRRQAARRRTTS
ncbi:putative RNA-binding Zn ribbon-like protein [Tamaricihabitans halophyticus]|uniref:Putative RNA-binding Zn ribbon-like protein n=1 Tax=Tamaricihabitans halophyticus TaxID=1262583 RepID=A0A4R2R440_9PSEU|nr:ABATE domain-containing protein [Tamaricihabitans halophyticus]TCP56654.1 putative RNA-binding Zn ribbon-like protein [Tamaricihabitans halophyticus]